MNLEDARDQMISQQLRTWDILDERVLEVMGAVPRERFLAEAYRGLAFADTSIPIGHGEVMLAPKVQGTRVLEQLFADSALDFMVLCSSISGGSRTSRTCRRWWISTPAGEGP